LEFLQAEYDAIAAATAKGIIVVEAAGNGASNLDDPAYNSLFNRAVRDSKAILVASSLSTSRSPYCSTNWGSRIDAHGWGENVVTLGYGDRFNGGSVNRTYTEQFSGTSSASPMVAGAAVSLQGAARAANLADRSPLAMRQLIASTGTPQVPGSKSIGPLPNLRAALDQLVGSPLQISQHPVPRTVAENGSTTFQCLAAGGQGAVSYRWQYSLTGGSYSNLSNGGGISGATSSTLGVNPVTLARRGFYRCRATDSASPPVQVFSNAAQLTVTCAANSTTLCLQANRFKAQLTWRDAGGNHAGLTLPYSSAGGFYHFGNAAAAQVGVKVLNAGSAFWVFHGTLTSLEYTLTVTDMTTGTVKTYFKPAGSLCGAGDTGGFPSGFAASSFANGFAVSLDADQPAGFAAKAACVPTSTSVCLVGGRFRAEVKRNGVAQPAVLLTNLTGVFWFGSATNPEVAVKILDATLVNGKFWVFFGSLTSQTYQVVVTDTVTGQVKTYNSQAPFCGLGDTTAF
jgi:hypothetical protein